MAHRVQGREGSICAPFYGPLNVDIIPIEVQQHIAAVVEDVWQEESDKPKKTQDLLERLRLVLQRETEKKSVR